MAKEKVTTDMEVSQLEEFNERNVQNKNVEDSKQEQKDVVATRLKLLESDLVKSKESVDKLSQTVESQNQQLRDKNNTIEELKKDLRSKNKTIATLDAKLEPESLWKRFKKYLPDILIDGQNNINQWKKKFESAKQRAEEAKQQATHYKNKHDHFVATQYDPLFQRFNRLQSQLQQYEQEWNQEKKNLLSEKQSLKVQNDELQQTVNKQLGQIASFKDKPAESILDYEKPENYQIVTDYRAFCTQQSLEVITDDIYSYFSQQQELQEEDKRVVFIAETKATLSKFILVKAYKMQFRQLGNRQPLLEFDNFFELHCPNMLSQLKLPDNWGEKLEKKAKKGFDIICQLVSTNPPCQLSFAIEGDIFDPEEHELATGCPQKGVVKFTVVPGVLSGYQMLAKPVVFTEK
ncbi:MAG: hypothetical protein VSS75_016175 [Candidatus Parabeggiatoa sp.]|nr:hypothetical protein [Candidatus Parabeggiatoa sp.]